MARHHPTDFNPGLNNARSRLQWASGRRTTEQEDVAYSLFGVFNVFLPIVPGETAENALGRLLPEIISWSVDTSVLDWVGPVENRSLHSYFPSRITSYQTIPCRSLTCNDNRLQPSMSLALGRLKIQIKLSKTLSMSDPLQFIGRRLRLIHQVTAVQLEHAKRYVYAIQAEGLIPFEITLSVSLTIAGT
ncbi:hypothetical protein SCLCIDRAFT_1152521 [Scleroderma citrinum Foug A]|uniref:Uncharacterized protein n=1 Tax=Scleroderma citrinum Foug A TaxID=1036808 RepID=A0A0C3DEQ2_9AGAM|nr:hypothetical protein SCLCIDRAFT_1152521 [Scleroderma citrinum Foug A]